VATVLITAAASSAVRVCAASEAFAGQKCSTLLLLLLSLLAAAMRWLGCNCRAAHLGLLGIASTGEHHQVALVRLEPVHVLLQGATTGNMTPEHAAAESLRRCGATLATADHVAPGCQAVQPYVVLWCSKTAYSVRHGRPHPRHCRRSCDTSGTCMYVVLFELLVAGVSKCTRSLLHNILCKLHRILFVPAQPFPASWLLPQHLATAPNQSYSIIEYNQAAAAGSPDSRACPHSV
jgi:hypothetical protein